MSNLLLSKIGHVISEFPLAFKQTKEVKLFMTLLVKNEEGMLEENLQFHKAMGVDGFIITDNNSTDSTPDIIRKYKQKGWIKEVIEEKATNYEQKDWVDRMIWKAKTIYKADWIITAASSEANGIAVYNLHGSIDDVKQTLVAFAASDRKNDEHCYEHGCKSVDDVIDSSDGCGWLFSAYSTYDNYHIDYQAIRADYIQPIKR